MNQPSPSPATSELSESNLDRALRCRVCTDADIVNNAPADPTEPAPQSTGRSRRRPVTLTIPQAQLLWQAWDHLAATQPGTTPDQRLLAMVCLLRGVRTGIANLTSQDMRALRVADQRATVAGLTEPGWLRTTPETVLNAEPQSPAACGLPQFEGNPWQVGNKVRPRTSGWTTRVLTHKLLRKQSNEVRLAALYLTAHARGEMVEFTPQHLMTTCALAGAEELIETLAQLQDRGWLAEGSAPDGPTVRFRLAPAVASFPLQVDPESATSQSSGRDYRGSGRTWPELDTAPNQTVRGHLLASGHEAEVAGWVHDFWQQHGHGPSWFTVAEAMQWPPRKHRYGRATQNAFAVLGEEGWLSGYDEPYGLCPGPRYNHQT